MAPNENFANAGAKTMTVGSRMNEKGEDPPF